METIKGEKTLQIFPRQHNQQYLKSTIEQMSRGDPSWSATLKDQKVRQCQKDMPEETYWVVPLSRNEAM